MHTHTDIAPYGIGKYLETEFLEDLKLELLLARDSIEIENICVDARTAAKRLDLDMYPRKNSTLFTSVATGLSGFGFAVAAIINLVKGNHPATEFNVAAAAALSAGSLAKAETFFFPPNQIDILQERANSFLKEQQNQRSS